MGSRDLPDMSLDLCIHIRQITPAHVTYKHVQEPGELYEQYWTLLRRLSEG